MIWKCKDASGGITAVYISDLNKWFFIKPRVQKLKKLLSGVNNKKVL